MRLIARAVGVLAATAVLVVPGVGPAQGQGVSATVRGSSTTTGTTGTTGGTGTGTVYGSIHTVRVHSSIADRLPTNTVALGDSYASGEANPPFDPGTDMTGDTCHRSSAAWPRLLGVKRMFHLACSGAVVANLTTTPQQTAAPDDMTQIRRLVLARKQLQREGQDVNAVTVMIGGNDIGFISVLTQCYFAECLTEPDQNAAQVRSVQPRLVAALRRVSKAAPHAQVYLVGYPRLFPQSQSTVTGCAWLSESERERANILSTELEAMQVRAARAAGVSFVSSAGALNRHELCTADSWLFPFDPLTYGAYPGQAHPIKQGQWAIVRSVRAALAR